MTTSPPATDHVRYTPKCDRNSPPDEQSVFYIRQLTRKEIKRAERKQFIVQFHATKRSTGNAAKVTKSEQRDLRVAAVGVAGWEQFNYADGEPVPARLTVTESIEHLAVESLEGLLNLPCLHEIAEVVRANARKG